MCLVNRTLINKLFSPYIYNPGFYNRGCFFMTTHYKQISISAEDPAIRELLLALLADGGYEGFEETRQQLIAYIPEQDFNEEMLLDILQPFSVSYVVETIEQRNWNAEWEAGFQPVTVGSFCTLRANFHEPVAGVVHDLIITPKMSFGTGHHATTWQMVAAMEQLDFTGKTVLDFGTGTGVLAILAHRLGAASVLAIDNDHWSIENARENLEFNGVTAGITIRLADSIEGTTPVDIILANINKKVVIDQLNHMVAACKPGGYILISGLLVSDAADLLAAIEAPPLTLIKQENKDSWLCWLVQRG